MDVHRGTWLKYRGPSPWRPSPREQKEAIAGATAGNRQLTTDYWLLLPRIVATTASRISN